MPTAASYHIEREHAPAETRCPAASPPAIQLDPSALTAALERRIAELSERLHAMTTERSILADELRFLRAGQKPAVEITATLATRGISM
jgi:hypothetical protein